MVEDDNTIGEGSETVALNVVSQPFASVTLNTYTPGQRPVKFVAPEIIEVTGNAHGPEFGPEIHVTV